jgi:hypothetical protein
MLAINALHKYPRVQMASKVVKILIHVLADNKNILKTLILKHSCLCKTSNKIKVTSIIANTTNKIYTPKEEAVQKQNAINRTINVNMSIMNIIIIPKMKEWLIIC